MSDTFNIVTEIQSEKSTCRVCGEIAPPGKKHTRHYGGIVCTSCGAFWRRAHQETRQPILICKSSFNNCEINADTRGKCPKCRYERCKLAGMRPEAVLVGDQKKFRFRLKRHQMVTAQKVVSSETLAYLHRASNGSGAIKRVNNPARWNPETQENFNYKLEPIFQQDFHPDAQPGPEDVALDLSGSSLVSRIHAKNDGFRKRVPELSKEYIRAFSKIR
jgi:hypothetical protein